MVDRRRSFHCLDCHRDDGHADDCPVVVHKIQRRDKRRAAAALLLDVLEKAQHSRPVTPAYIARCLITYLGHEDAIAYANDRLEQYRETRDGEPYVTEPGPWLVWREILRCVDTAAEAVAR